MTMIMMRANGKKDAGDSGYGLHAYYIFDSPIKISDDNREELKRRNNLLLDIIRQRANAKKIDGVGDLPRILRTPGTYNYKLGKDNAPLCHIVEDSGLRFSPSQLDDKLKVLIQPQAPKFQAAGSPPKKSKKDFADDSDFNSFRVRRMLDFISPSSLTYDDWLVVGMALKISAVTAPTGNNGAVLMTVSKTVNVNPNGTASIATATALLRFVCSLSKTGTTLKKFIASGMTFTRI